MQEISVFKNEHQLRVQLQMTLRSEWLHTKTNNNSGCLIWFFFVVGHSQGKKGLLDHHKPFDNNILHDPLHFL